MAKIISNINNNNNQTLTFNINNSDNNFKISLSNALRRTIINDINLYAIDSNKVEIIENNGTIDNELLKSRLSLIPINNELIDINYDNIIISCSIKNSEDSIINIYPKDFNIVERDEATDIEKKIEILDIFKNGYDNILFAKLKPNQSINFLAKLSSNNAHHGGAVYIPTSVCIYTFKVDENKCNELTKDMNEIEKKSFSTLERKRHYELTNKLEPNTFEFKIESVGQYSNMNILKRGIDRLSDRLIRFNNNIISDNSDVIEFKNYEGNINAIDLILKNENDTLGNLISQYLSEENIFFCGYYVQHPLIEELIIRISISNKNISNNNEKNVKQLINKVVNKILKHLNQLLDELK